MSADALTAAAERDRVLAVYDGSMDEGSQWMVLNADWLQQWASYVGINLMTRRPVATSTTQRPPPIDQSKLRDPAFPSIDILRPSLLEGVDYEVVPAAVAGLLLSAYASPTTATFPRSVISTGLSQHRRVDLYPAFLTLVPLSDSGEEREEEKRVEQFHTNCTWNDVRDAAIKQQQMQQGKGEKEEVKEEEEKEEVSGACNHTHRTHTALISKPQRVC